LSLSTVGCKQQDASCVFGAHRHGGSSSCLGCSHATTTTNCQVD
jgi:hypothetical protein